ncbi:MAG: choice-of-anchor I family protein [Deferribacteres bacterium]|nr:choice-of-anchor I family protein [Deferribacteres bacterium]
MIATELAANGRYFKRMIALAGLFSFLCAAPLAVAQSTSIQLTQIGTYASGIFAEGGAEIVAHDPGTQRLFVVNAQAVTLDVLDISAPGTPNLLFTIDVTPYGAGANSVAVHKGIVAVAVQNVDKQANGKVVFFDVDGTYLNDVTVGALPDMLTFTPNGKYLLVANEGEPNDDYTVDPEGTVSIIKLSKGVGRLTQKYVKTVDFGKYNNVSNRWSDKKHDDDHRRGKHKRRHSDRRGKLDPSVRIFGPGASVAQDIEPEYITVSDDSRTAWVVLQENNAIAVIDIDDAELEDIIGLGFKDHTKAGNGFDASNRDGSINIANWPTKGMYLPDGIVSFSKRGRTYLITANEGDSRDYDGYSEEVRVKDLVLDPIAFPDAATLQLDENLGRLKTTLANGDIDGDGDFDEIYSYGGRSFTIWNEKGKPIFDSGDAIEQITAAAYPDNFNSDNEENGSFDDRSDDKGPEPEGVVVGKIRSSTYAFIGLERMGGVVVYDVSNPYNPSFVQYINNRDFSGDPEAGTAGDLGPEGLAFIPHYESPTGKPLLVVGNEVSGTTTIYEIDVVVAKNSAPVLAEDQPAGLPTSLELHQNYPNPFNPTTMIGFSLPQDAGVKIRVVDLMGRTVATLTESQYKAGEHTVQFQANNLSSGNYFYALEVDGVVRQIRKLTLLK